MAGKMWAREVDWQKCPLTLPGWGPEGWGFHVSWGAGGPGPWVPWLGWKRPPLIPAERGGRAAGTGAGDGEPGATDQLSGAVILAICRSPSLGRGPRAVGAVQPAGEGQLASGVGTRWTGEAQGGEECVCGGQPPQQGAP